MLRSHNDDGTHAGFKFRHEKLKLKFCWLRLCLCVICVYDRVDITVISQVKFGAKYELEARHHNNNDSL